VAFLSLLEYYRPLPIVLRGEFPRGDALVLAGVALATWAAGLWRFARRDVPAV
jgi:hypothetical protein